MSCRTGPLRVGRAFARLFTGFASPLPLVGVKRITTNFFILSEVEGPAFPLAAARTSILTNGKATRRSKEVREHPLRA
jgi:hypothetical protein